MSVKFISPSSQSEFSQLLQSGGELRELFGLFMAQLELNTDYDTGMVGFEPDGSLRCRIEDSPFLVIFAEGQQQIYLQRCDEDDEIFLDVNEWDFDEDAVEEVVDYIGDQILTSETYGI